MKQSNENRSESQRKRAEKNKERISAKPRLSKHERWEMAERLRIIQEALMPKPEITEEQKQFNKNMLEVDRALSRISKP